MAGINNYGNNNGWGNYNANRLNNYKANVKKNVVNTNNTAKANSKLNINNSDGFVKSVNDNALKIEDSQQPTIKLMGVGSWLKNTWRKICDWLCTPTGNGYGTNGGQVCANFASNNPALGFHMDLMTAHHEHLKNKREEGR